MLRFPGQFYELLDLREDHFQVPVHRKIFKALRLLWDEEGVAAMETPSIIAEAMTRWGVSHEESLAVFSAARDFAPESVAAIRSIKTRLVTKAMKSALREHANELLELAGSDKDQDEVTTAAQDGLNSALRRGATAEVRSMADAMEEEIARMDPANTASEMGYSTGLDALDKKTTGLHGGELWVIGGRPSMGKSSLMNHMAMALAFQQGLPGVIFSLEMRCSEWCQRLLCALTQCDIQQARLRALPPDQRETYVKWAERMRATPLNIYDQGGISMSRASATIRRLAFEEDVKWVGIDYLQLVDHKQGKSESTNDAIARTSRMAKMIALSLDVPVILLSQLNRDCESRKPPKPQLSDLRSSGSIEQDADVVVLLFREEHYHADDENWRREHMDKCGLAELIVAKQRNGPIGTVDVAWRGQCAAFGNLDHDGTADWGGAWK